MKPLPGGASSFGQMVATLGNRGLTTCVDNLRQIVTAVGLASAAMREQLTTRCRNRPMYSKAYRSKNSLAWSLLQIQALGPFAPLRHVPNVELSRSVFQ